jgi:hypothetical protein
MRELAYINDTDWKLATKIHEFLMLKSLAPFALQLALAIEEAMKWLIGRANQEGLRQAALVIADGVEERLEVRRISVRAMHARHVLPVAIDMLADKSVPVVSHRLLLRPNPISHT